MEHHFERVMQENRNEGGAGAFSGRFWECERSKRFSSGRLRPLKGAQQN